jgi:hypothetical protein
VHLVLIQSEPESAVTRLFDQLGVVYQTRPLLEALASDSPSEKVALIISENEMINSHAVAQARGTTLVSLMAGYASVLIWPFEGTDKGVLALSEWTGAKNEVNHPALGTPFSAGRSSLCGPFAGLRFNSANPADFGLVTHQSSHAVETIVSLGESSFFTRFQLPSTELFLVCSGAIFDPDAEVLKNLSVANCFSGLVPLLLFLRRCRIAFWHGSRPLANVIIDDPNLKPRYGFLDIRLLARCVADLRFAISIGFIPWNYRRASSSVIEMFRSQWPGLSICVHGCDHTGAEFSTKTPAEALQLIARGLERMRSFTARTRLSCDKVMVFPQGKFSAAAMQAFAQTELIAAVNTELLDYQAGKGVRAGELLQPAVTAYSGFPLFQRRPPESPIADFALDLLLGKPCLVVAHHDYFEKGMGPLISLVQSLNALDSKLEWTNLESVVSKAFSVRAASNSVADVRLFGSPARFVPGDLPPKARFSKIQPPATSLDVLVDGRPLDWIREDGRICFESSNANQLTRIEVRAPKLENLALTRLPIKRRAKIAARRYLSEIRDNYVARAAWTSPAISFARRVTRGFRAHAD